MYVQEGQDQHQQRHDAPQVEPPVRPEEVLIDDAQDLVQHQQQQARREAEGCGEEGGHQAIDLVVGALAKVVLQELVTTHEQPARRYDGEYLPQHLPETRSRTWPVRVG